MSDALRFVLLTQSTVRIFLLARALTLKVPGRVYTGSRCMATVHIVVALVDVYALGALHLGALVARLTPAVVPAGHVDAQRRLVVTPVQPGRALVQILLTGRPNESHTTRADIGRYALTPIQAAMFAHGCGARSSNEGRRMEKQQKEGHD